MKIRHQIDQKVMDLYRLSSEEIVLVNTSCK
jgi:hypothetical protein